MACVNQAVDAAAGLPIVAHYLLEDGERVGDTATAIAWATVPAAKLGCNPL